jgi:hypothetical protein
MYKASKDQVNVFGLQTQFGGGKTTGFALVYDSPEALKKFEPHYRLVRVGVATKIEKASRQQRMSTGYIIIPGLSIQSRISYERKADNSILQASNARTDKRLCGVRRRSRVPRRRRRNRRLAHLEYERAWDWVLLVLDDVCTHCTGLPFIRVLQGTASGHDGIRLGRP